MKNALPSKIHTDPWLLVTTVIFLLIGLMMVTTASGYIAEYYGLSPYHYGIRQLMYIAIGIIVGGFIYIKVDLVLWYRLTPILMIITIICLILVLIPGIGREVNGALRWIPISVFNFQPAEVAKFSIVMYIASYLHRHKETIDVRATALIIPLVVMGFLGILLLLEPDFGSTVIIFVIGLGLLFIAGVSIWQFLCVLVPTLGVMAFVVLTSPYRRARLSGFMNPWDDPYNQGYQLANSLIAIGRGKLSGVGIGESMSKLGYLPEAHTDFIFSIYAEEFGFFGVVILVFLYLAFVYRTFDIGRRAEELKRYFAAYISYGIGFWFGTQALIHMCVASGLLPTKGLTLPLISYGGSSIVMMLIALSVLFKVDRFVQTEELVDYQKKQARKAEQALTESNIKVGLK
ncbi:putative lipid II flippase FtsW [Ignatzschineria larvae DSM 13226]|uniref:Probable peptidoglycan glycosyltransferase FtsW n=1 Tax=Ignatzschineria larvae DSM 13226 TaxID=1111732 RepID=A0ABZ3C052_9GAMM|nr:putative lipid II flippase FtsW [Ignatzschineria larvae]